MGRGCATDKGEKTERRNDRGKEVVGKQKNTGKKLALESTYLYRYRKRL